MSNATVLTPEPREADPRPIPGSRSESRVVTRAVFPRVDHVDRQRTAALAMSVRQWLDLVIGELARQLRAPCRVKQTREESIASDRLPLADEVSLWGRVEEYEACYLVVSLPRSFAATVCERVFAAPLAPQPDRDLSPGEQRVLRHMANVWMGLIARVWINNVICACPPPDKNTSAEEEQATEWLRFTATIVCESVEGAVSLSMNPSCARVLLGEVAQRGPLQNEADQLLARLSEVPVGVRALLGQAEFTLVELSSLRVGDIIVLDRKAAEPIDILIEEEPFCQARPCLAGQFVALELLDNSIEVPNES